MKLQSKKFHVTNMADWEEVNVSISDTLFTAFFCMAVVFVVLGGLFVLTNVCADAVRIIEAKMNK